MTSCGRKANRSYVSKWLCSMLSSSNRSVSMPNMCDCRTQQHKTRSITTAMIRCSRGSQAALGSDFFLFLVTLQVLQNIMSINEEKTIHGLIVQLPLDSVHQIDSECITNTVSPDKDVDGSVHLLICFPNFCLYLNMYMCHMIHWVGFSLLIAHKLQNRL